ncbi:MAG: PA2778 family cysteine peptidase [Wenzhouxiangellaceae bacterium]|nr:PA2778 family cysteine peptidase [Wenzhouxiangellaceae bacterium]
MPRKHNGNRNKGAAALAALSLLLAGCASFDTKIPQSWAPRVELSETPFYPQLKHHCGPSALITVLESSGAEPTYDEVADRIYVPDLEGSLQVELMAATRSFERIPFRLAGEFEAVLAEVEAGRPVLILQNLRVRSVPAWHYAVVIGYDRERGEILMRSGSERLQATPAQRWMRQWDWASRWAIVVLEPGQLPANPDLPAALRALADFDDHAAAAPRLRAWQAAAEQWPDEALAWMGTGNARYELGTLEAAATDFEHALELKPDSWPARLNLAQVLLELDRSCPGREIIEAQPMLVDHPLVVVHGKLALRLARACDDSGGSRG